ncbi:hypothetical protein Nepgr_000809 [Nepenthes gracilis]|uniref:Uncharacterized protein n=1 Tax=Nepenthes gracilis TaxID=150966 RepID=A0AAD3RX60_NEPGR|nr:hypothetical protein Nepgr_000809 [Nepenthes gracilis]
MEFGFNHEYLASFRHKLKSSICSSCCIMNRHHDVDEVPLQESDRRSLIRSPSSWIKSKPEIKDKCVNLLSRIGRSRRCNNTADFRYDPLSYALNFDDDSRTDEFPLRNFSSRSPPTEPVVVSREIAAWS